MINQEAKDAEPGKRTMKDIDAARKLADIVGGEVTISPFSYALYETNVIRSDEPKTEWGGWEHSATLLSPTFASQ